MYGLPMAHYVTGHVARHRVWCAMVHGASVEYMSVVNVKVVSSQARKPAIWHYYVE